MATHNGWQDDLQAALNPSFFEEAEPVIVEEVSWHHAEKFVDETDEVIALQAEEQISDEEQPSDAQLRQKQWEARTERYAALDEQLLSVLRTSDEPFALSPFMARDLKAFRTVISSYLRESQRSSTKTMNYTGETHGTRKAYKPTRLDFICDVELVAKRALKHSAKLTRIFQKAIVEESGEQWTAVPAKTRNKIEEVVGKNLNQAGMYPLSRYFS